MVASAFSLPARTCSVQPLPLQVASIWPPSTSWMPTAPPLTGITLNLTPVLAAMASVISREADTCEANEIGLPLFLCAVDHVLERIVGAVRLHHDGVGRIGQRGQMREVVDLVLDVLVDLRRERIGGAGAHADGVAVRLGIDELRGHDGAAAARLGDGDDRLAENLRHLVGDQAAGGVDGAAGTEADIHGDRLGREIRCARESAGQRHGQRGGRQSQHFGKSTCHLVSSL